MEHREVCALREGDWSSRNLTVFPVLY